MVSFSKEQSGQEPTFSLGHHQTLGAIFDLLRLTGKQEPLGLGHESTPYLWDIIRFALAEKEILLIPKMVLGCC